MRRVIPTWQSGDFLEAEATVDHSPAAVRSISFFFLSPGGSPVSTSPLSSRLVSVFVRRPIDVPLPLLFLRRVTCPRIPLGLLPLSATRSTQHWTASFGFTQGDSTFDTTVISTTLHLYPCTELARLLTRFNVTRLEGQYKTRRLGSWLLLSVRSLTEGSGRTRAP